MMYKIHKEKVCSHVTKLSPSPIFPPPVTDPKFPRVGATTAERGRQPTIRHNFCQKLHDNEKIGLRGGMYPPRH